MRARETSATRKGRSTPRGLAAKPAEDRRGSPDRSARIPDGPVSKCSEETYRRHERHASRGPQRRTLRSPKPGLQAPSETPSSPTQTVKPAMDPVPTHGGPATLTPRQGHAAGGAPLRNPHPQPHTGPLDAPGSSPRTSGAHDVACDGPTWPIAGAPPTGSGPQICPNGLRITPVIRRLEREMPPTRPPHPMRRGRKQRL